jgi:hypothetical protein
MTLAAFARLVGTTPKWVLNTLSTLGRRPRYSVDLARRLAVTREIHDGLGVPLSLALALAQQALRVSPAAGSPVTLYAQPDSSVALTIDLYRLLSTFNVRLAELRESYAPPALGRPRTRSFDPLAAATEWGLDLSLIRDNMRKTPHQRLRQLDAMHAFAKNVRRASAVI